MAGPAGGGLHPRRPGESKGQPKLVDALPVRPRTRVRFPPPPLDALTAKEREKSRYAGESPARRCERTRKKRRPFATVAAQRGSRWVARGLDLGRMRPN